MYHFTKQIDCSHNEDPSLCGNKITKQLEDDLNIVLMAKNKTQRINGHVSIFHAKGAHQIWVFSYDEDNIHESWGLIVKEKYNSLGEKVKDRYRGKKFVNNNRVDGLYFTPLQSEIEAIIEKAITLNPTIIKRV